MAAPITNMKALVIDKDHKIALKAATVPKPAEGEVLIRVHASSLNPVDWKASDWLKGDRYGGFDFAGEVVEGEHQGKACIGFKSLKNPNGTWAEFAAVNIKSTGFLPDDLCKNIKQGVVSDGAEAKTEKGEVNWAQLGCLGIAGLTAWGLVKKAGVKKGDTVLLQRAHSGVGHILLQLLRRAGCGAIVATEIPGESAHKFCREQLRCDLVLESPGYTEEDKKKIWNVTGGRGAHIYFHLHGNIDDRVLPALGEGGRVIALGGKDQTIGTGRHQVLGFNVSDLPAEEQATALVELATLLSKGELLLHVNRTLPLEAKEVEKALNTMKGHEKAHMKGEVATGGKGKHCDHCGKTAILVGSTTTSGE